MRFVKKKTFNVLFKEPCKSLLTFLISRLIKEEKQNTEMRAEELENRVNIIDLKDDKLRSMSPQNGVAGSPKHFKTGAGLFSAQDPPAFDASSMESVGRFNDYYVYKKNCNPLHGSANNMHLSQEVQAASHSQNSPTSSKNSSNDSLNYLANKNEQLIEKNFNTLTSNLSLPYSDGFNNLNYSNGKKKSLKNAFYRIFMQRKKSKYSIRGLEIDLRKDIGLIWAPVLVQKYSTLQKYPQNSHLIYNSDSTQAVQNTPTIKIESDKKLKKMLVGFGQMVISILTIGHLVTFFLFFFRQELLE